MGIATEPAAEPARRSRRARGPAVGIAGVHVERHRMQARTRRLEQAMMALRAQRDARAVRAWPPPP